MIPTNIIKAVSMLKATYSYSIGNNGGTSGNSWATASVDTGNGYCILSVITVDRGNINAISVSGSGTVSALGSALVNSNLRLQFWYLKGGDGGSQTITITNASTGGRAAFAIYHLNKPLITESPLSTQSGTGSAFSTTINAPAGGIVLAISSPGNANGTTSVTGLDLDFNTLVSTSRPFGGASRSFTADITAHPINVTRSNTDSANRGVLISSFK